MDGSTQPRRISVYLNVYDLEESTKYNNYTYYFGFGVFHSGIVLFGQEYSFGGHDEDSTGIFWVEPGTVPMFKFRTRVDLGQLVLSKSDLTEFLDEMGDKYRGNSYHILQRNCNHFIEEFCERMGIYFPGWVNRLAKALNYCQCLVPPQYLQPPTAEATAEVNAAFTPFAGEGHKLSGSVNSTNNMDGSNSILVEDKEIKRKLLEQATLKRLGYDTVTSTINNEKKHE